MRLDRGYHGPAVVGQLNDAIDGVVGMVQEWRNNGPAFSHIAVTGVSGQSVGWPVSARLNIPLLVVKKPHEQGHSRNLLIGDGELGNYIILDDFISTGRTMENIRNTIQAEYEDQRFNYGALSPPPQPVGIILYGTSRTEDFTFDDKTTIVPVKSMELASIWW